MRSINPPKASCLVKSVKLLCLSAALLSWHSFDAPDKANAMDQDMDLPVLPPSMELAKADSVQKVTPAKQATITKSKIKAVASEKKADMVAASIENATAEKNEKIQEASNKSTKKDTSKVTKLTANNGSKTSSSSISDATILPDMLPVNDELDAEEEDVDDDFEFDEEEDIKPVKKTEAKTAKKADVKPEVKSEIKAEPKAVAKVQGNKAEFEEAPVVLLEVKSEPKAEAKVDKKVETKKAEKPAIKVETKKVEAKAEIKKAEPKAESKVEAKAETKAVVKTATKSAPKTTAKKSVKPTKKIVDDSVIPEGWDWFSAPIVFRTNAEGKRVLVADTSAKKEAPLVSYIEPMPAVDLDVEQPQKVAESEEATKIEEKPFAKAIARLAEIRKNREASSRNTEMMVAKASNSARQARVKQVFAEILKKNVATEVMIAAAPKTKVVHKTPTATKKPSKADADVAPAPAKKEVKEEIKVVVPMAVEAEVIVAKAPVAPVSLKAEAKNEVSFEEAKPVERLYEVASRPVVEASVNEVNSEENENTIESKDQVASSELAEEPEKIEFKPFIGEFNAKHARIRAAQRRAALERRLYQRPQRYYWIK